MTVVLKLGGSVLTEKDEPETVDEGALTDAADALAGFARRTDRAADETGTEVGDGSTTDGEGLVVVHGGGSFGHHHAERHGVGVDSGTRDADAAGAIHGAMKRLNDRVVTALRERGVPALPVHPLSVAARDADGDLTVPTAAIEGLLAEGFVPVTHGDVVATAGEGVTVLSGDEIVVAVAPAVDADRVGLCSTVPGVLDADGAVIDRIERFDEVADALGGSEATDVTGGMAGKVRSLLGLAAPAQVFGPADLPAFVAGDRPGTTVAGGGDNGD